MVNHIRDAHLRDAAALDVLADPGRRAVIALLARQPRPAGELAAALGVSRPAMSRHLRLLRTRGLVSPRRTRGDGRVRLYTLSRDPLDEVAHWVDAVRWFWSRQLDAFAAFVEAEVSPPQGGRTQSASRRRSRDDGRSADRQKQRRGTRRPQQGL